MLSASSVKDALAVLGALVIVGIVAFIGGAYYGREGLERQAAAADSAYRRGLDSAEKAGVASSARADSLVRKWQTDSATVASLLARPPRIDTLRFHDTVGPAVPMPVVLFSSYDSLARWCTATLGSCHGAIASADSARDAARAALAEALARPPIIVAPKASSFLGRLKVCAGPTGMVAFDDRRLHDGLGVTLGWSFP